MTIQEIISLINANPRPIITYYLVIIAIAIIASILVSRDNYKAPFTYLFSAIVYAVSIPGLMSIILILYGFFFQKINFLQVNLVSYFLPLTVLIAIFVLLNKAVRLKNIPGFGRISGLFIVILISMFIAYVLQKMFFGIIFFGSFQTLIIIFLIILVVIRLAWNKLVK